MPTNEEMNKYLTEKVMGECWYDKWEKTYIARKYNLDEKWACVKCGATSTLPELNPNYFTSGHDWFALKMKIQEDKELWRSFMLYLSNYFWSTSWGNFFYYAFEEVMTLEVFPKLVYEFMKGREVLIKRSVNHD